MEKTQDKKITKEQLHNKFYNLVLTGLVLMMALFSFAGRTFASNDLQDFKALLEPYTTLNYTASIIGNSPSPDLIRYKYDNPELTNLNIVNKELFIWFDWVGVGDEPLFFDYYDTNTNFSANVYNYFKYSNVSYDGLNFKESTVFRYLGSYNYYNYTTDNLPLFRQQFGQLSNNIFQPYFNNPSSISSFTINLNPLYFQIDFAANFPNTTKRNEFLQNYVLKLGVAPSLTSVLNEYKSSFDLETVQEQYYNLGYDAGYLAGYDAGVEFATNATIESAYQQGYNLGYQEGLAESNNQAGTIYQTAYNKGYQDSLSQNRPTIYQQGYVAGQNAGYQEGLQDGNQNPIISMITQSFGAVGTILDVQILPSITLGSIILIPILFSIIAFILGKKNGGN